MDSCAATMGDEVNIVAEADHLQPFRHDVLSISEGRGRSWTDKVLESSEDLTEAFCIPLGRM